MGNERETQIALRDHETRLRKLEQAADLPVGTGVELPVMRAKKVPFRPLTEAEQEARITDLVKKILAQQTALGPQPTDAPKAPAGKAPAKSGQE